MRIAKLSLIPAALTAMLAATGMARADDVLEKMVGPIRIGDASAPTQVDVFSYFGCPACANLNADINDGFNLDDTPLANAVRSGKMAINYRLTPRDREGHWAEQIARCTSDPAEAMRRLFKTTGIWHTAGYKHGNARKYIKPEWSYARLIMGRVLIPDLISGEDFQKCERNQDASKALLNDRSAAMKKVKGLKSYPAIMHEGKVVDLKSTDRYIFLRELAGRL